MNNEGRPFLEATLPHLDVIYRVARHASQDHRRAEDLVQETYLRAYAAFGNHRGPSTKAWLVTICVNLARSEGRRQARRVVETALPPSYEPEAAGVSVPEEALASLDRGSISTGARPHPRRPAAGHRPHGPGRPQCVRGGRNARLPAQHRTVPGAPGPPAPCVAARRGGRQP